MTYLITANLIPVDIDIMMTKQHQSNKVTRLKVVRNVYENITNKTAGQHVPRKYEFYIRDKKLTGFWIRVTPNGRKVYGCYGRLFGVGAHQ